VNKFQQLSLGIKLDNQATFDNFYAPNGTPQHLAKMLLQDEGKQYAYLCGSSGTGLSHLLQALCQSHSLRPGTGAALYMPLKELRDYPADQVLQGLESADIVCLDDFDEVAAREEWQQPLFNFFNRCNESGTRLIIAAHTLPDFLEVILEDLLSRLKSGISLQLIDYKDADLRRLLQHRASGLGLYLSDEVALFLLHRLPRNSHVLMESLDKLDAVSLREQRRLTLPFVKGVLEL
jgi:DnaA family protein